MTSWRAISRMFVLQKKISRAYGFSHGARSFFCFFFAGSTSVSAGGTTLLDFGPGFPVLIGSRTSFALSRMFSCKAVTFALICGSAGFLNTTGGDFFAFFGGAIAPGKQIVGGKIKNLKPSKI
uniref:(northern house mosquito) hypothetical protein n=1 Tax=Culex pipiens TaxID=7175 RepID=A0A8D8G1L3_CULPI